MRTYVPDNYYRVTYFTVWSKSSKKNQVSLWVILYWFDGRNLCMRDTQQLAFQFSLSITSLLSWAELTFINPITHTGFWREFDALFSLGILLLPMMMITHRHLSSHLRMHLKARPHQQQCRSNRQHCRSYTFDFVEATFDFVATNGNNVERVS